MMDRTFFRGLDCSSEWHNGINRYETESTSVVKQKHRPILKSTFNYAYNTQAQTSVFKFVLLANDGLKKQLENNWRAILLRSYMERVRRLRLGITKWSLKWAFLYQKCYYGGCQIYPSLINPSFKKLIHEAFLFPEQWLLPLSWKGQPCRLPVTRNCSVFTQKKRLMNRTHMRIVKDQA